MNRGFVVFGFALFLNLISVPFIFAQVDTAWVRNWPGSSTSDFKVDKAGNLYVTGSIGSPKDMLTVRYNTDGTLVWSHRYDHQNRGLEDLAHGILMDAYENVYVVGGVWDSVTLVDGIAIKYSPGGTLQWAKTIDPGDSAMQFFGDAVCDSFGYVTMTQAAGEPGTWVAMFNAKLDPNGNRIWSDVDSTVNEVFYRMGQIATDNLQNVFVLGKLHTTENWTLIKYSPGGFRTWQDFNLGSSASGSLFADGLGNVYALFYAPGVIDKFGQGGNIVWTKNLDVTERYTMSMDSKKNVIVCGGTVSTSSGPYFTVKYDSLGNELWHSSYGGHVLVLDRKDNIYILDNLSKMRCIDPDSGTLIWEKGIIFPGSFKFDNRGNIYVRQGAQLVKYYQQKVLVIRDVHADTIPDVKFQLIKVSTPPLYKEDTLGKFMTDSLGQFKLKMIDLDTIVFEADSLNAVPDTLLVGDKIRISKLVHYEPAAKHLGVLGTMYSINLDNAKFDTLGVMSFDTLNSRGKQDIVLDHTELRYNLLVSVEWDAAESYLTSLQDGFRAMSNYLYDVSDGQVRLDTVMIFDNKEHWEEADMRIHANNVEWPCAVPAGIKSSDPDWTTYLPRKWFGNPDACRNGSYSENPLVMTDGLDYRSKCHEFGHYGLGFYDEYSFVGTGDRCPSIDNYGFMDHQYEGWGEWASEMSNNSRYTDPGCQNTEQYYYLGNSCWNNLESCFEKKYGSDSIFVPIIKPGDPERSLPSGLDYFPGPNNEKYFTPAAMDYDVGALIRFPVQPLPPDPDIVTLNVEVISGGPVPKADVTIINNYFSMNPKTIYQGQTDDGNGSIRVVGASQSNRLIQASTGYITILPYLNKKLAATTGNRVWLCGEASVGGSKEKRVNNQFWSNGDSLTIQLKAVEGDYPLICGIELGNNTLTYNLSPLNLFSSNPALELFPDLGGYSTDTFSYDGTKYTSQITDSLGNSGMFTIWAVDDSSQDFFFNTYYTITRLDTSAVIWNLTGPQGASEAWIDTINLGIQRGMILSSPYLIIRTGLDSVNIQAGETHSLSVYPLTALTGNNRLTIRYADSDLDLGAGLKGKETSLKIFHWNEGSSQWQQIGGTVDTIQNSVSSYITETGVYAAFTTELLTDVKEEGHGSGIPDRFDLRQNYPNPFNPACNIEYSLPKGSHVSLSIYNILGQKVRTLVNEYQSAGYKSVRWDGKDNLGREVTSGIYFDRIKAGDFVQAKKMVLIR
jgi:hypothetical protein